jgi:transposase
VLIPSVRVFLATERIDLRRGFDGLAAAVRDRLAGDPASGAVFVFLGRNPRLAKLLFWDRSGYVLIAKRLEKGCFSLPRPARSDVRQLEIEPAELLLLLEGIELAGSRRRERWKPQTLTSF